MLFLLPFLISSRSFQIPALHRVDLHDERIFEISADESEDDENEMIKPDKTFKEFELMLSQHDDSRYKPLHLYVENYNRKHKKEISAIHSSQQLPALNVLSNVIEKDSMYDEEPFVAGYKQDLDKITDLRSKRSDNKNEENPFATPSPEGMDFFKMVRKTPRPDSETESNSPTQERSTEMSQTLPAQGGFSPIERSWTTIEEYIEHTDEIAYDYESFKAEYDQLLLDRKNETFNYTDKGGEEKGLKDIVGKLVDVKRPSNCTKEELTRIGFKAVECLVHDYRHAKDKAHARKLLARTWLVLKIWICIYVCIAIPCWCQRGWCCCCFRCSFCFPKKRIAIAKKYYTVNVPGTMTKDFLKPLREQDRQQIVRYEPTEFEEDAYEKFEAALRNL